VKRRGAQEREEADAHEQAEARRLALLAELKAHEAAARAPAAAPQPEPEPEQVAEPVLDEASGAKTE
jgi:hypothetical protein